MSANKGFETKLHEDENTESGYLTGEISGLCEPEPEPELMPSAPEKQDDQKKKEECDLDSGLVLIPEDDFNVHITDTTINLPTSRSSDIPPLHILFQQDDDGDTQLHIASVHGCEKSVGTLIRLCPDKAWLDVPNDYGHTPLHLAVMSRNPIVTRMLVIAGVSLGVRDRLGETPLHKATVIRDSECIKALLTPVPEKPRKLSSVLEEKNYRGQACVHIAASAGHVETLQSLVYYGADINSAENLAGWTPLHIAARRGDVRMVQYLSERCSGVTVRARDYAGRTPRHLARYTKAEKLFVNFKDDSDTESDSDDDDMYDSDSETLFEKMLEQVKAINVA
ncbi:hypothetical protein K1T71_008688 [Dendrolimus kikuchii]|uniref:Uncharacterized protein n=1 Tax=Dendrolimus kikuchii TaxID=765133 RepID=A0ACC1CV14_9NEOP|nr:hypothetical protein K1T71_008688 [Dendrolimus kikuchii]